MAAMDERSSRMFAGVCLLVLLWIGTYWVYDPTPGDDTPRISFAEQAAPPEIAPSPEVEPRTARRPPVVQPVFEPPPEPKPVETGVRVVPPEFRDYIIRPGDTLQIIARDQLGSEQFWSAIAQANPLKDPRRLRVGETLRLPIDPTNIQGRVVNADGTPHTPPPADPAKDIVEYVVQPGDSLSKIAQAYYGSIRHADFIYESNRDVLPDRDSLSVGQTLKLRPLGAP